MQTRRAAVSNSMSQKYIFEVNIILRTLLTREIAKSRIALQSEFVRARLSHGQSTSIHDDCVHGSAVNAPLHAPAACWWAGSQNPIWRDYSSLRLHAGY